MNQQLSLFPEDSSNSPVTPTLADHVAELMKQMLDRKHMIEAALAYAEGTHTFDDIVAMVLQNRLYWMALPNSFIITEIVTYPRMKHLNGFLAGGDLEEIRKQQYRLIEAAQLAGCSAITLSGRRGWVKALRDLGWRESHTSIVLDVQPYAENEDGQKGRIGDAND